MVRNARAIFRGHWDLSEVLGKQGQDMLGPGAMVLRVVNRRLWQHDRRVASHRLLYLPSPPPDRLAPSMDGADRHALPLCYRRRRLSLIPLFPASLHDHGRSPDDPQQKLRQETERLLALCATKPLHRHRPGLLHSSPHPAHGPIIVTPANGPPLAMRADRSPSKPPSPPELSQVRIVGVENPATGGSLLNRIATLPRPGLGASGVPVFTQLSLAWLDEFWSAKDHEP